MWWLVGIKDEIRLAYSRNPTEGVTYRSLYNNTLLCPILYTYVHIS